MTVTAIGWGDTDETDGITMASSTLQQVNLNIISNVDCEDSTDSNGINYMGQITNSMICAHDVKGGGKDACQVRNRERERDLLYTFSFFLVFPFFFIYYIILLSHY